MYKLMHSHLSWRNVDTMVGVSTCPLKGKSVSVGVTEVLELLLDTQSEAVLSKTSDYRGRISGL